MRHSTIVERIQYEPHFLRGQRMGVLRTGPVKR
jgi:hypothetical protein